MSCQTIWPNSSGSHNDGTWRLYNDSGFNDSAGDGFPWDVTDPWNASAVAEAYGGPSPRLARVYRDAQYVIETFLLPIVFAVGLTGNACNLAVLSRRRFRGEFNNIERSANFGMVAMAVSDMCFCAAGFASVFFAGAPLPESGDVRAVVGFHYQVYRPALLNVFLLCSTWLMVHVALERYLAICHPFQARWLIKVRRSIIAHVTFAVVAVLLTVPQFLKYAVKTSPCYVNCTCYFLQIRPLWAEPHVLVHVHKALWGLLGTLFPFLALLYCNARMLHIICQIQYGVMSIGSCDQPSNRRITITLVAMATLFLLLVFPSMFLAYAADYHVYSSSDTSMDVVYYYQIAILVANLMLALRFASNFSLYCVTNAQFRQTISSAICKTRTATSLSNGSRDHRFEPMQG